MPPDTFSNPLRESHLLVVIHNSSIITTKILLFLKNFIIIKMLATCIATINNLVKSIKAVFLSHFNPQDYIHTKIPAKIRGLRKKISRK